MFLRKSRWTRVAKKPTIDCIKVGRETSIVGRQVKYFNNIVQLDTGRSESPNRRATTVTVMNHEFHRSGEANGVINRQVELHRNRGRIW